MDENAIPEDVMAVAKSITTNYPMRLEIARAILAERERCAKIAESHGDTWSGSRDVDVALQEAAVDEKVVEIATAIRSGVEDGRG